MPLTTRRPLHGQSGLSIIELMVGVALGLIIVAGGAKLLADGLVGNRQVVVESRISQDLRAATDVIAREVRRAGFWQRSFDGVTANPELNAYRAISAAPDGGVVQEIVYRYDRDGDNAVNNTTEVFGFRRAEVGGIGQLQMQIGANAWQPLTDIASVDVTTFAITPVTAEIRLGDMCRTVPLDASVAPKPACCRRHPGDNSRCKPDFFERRVGGAYVPDTGISLPTGTVFHDACPELHVRSFDLVIEGRGLPPNQNVRREIREAVRVRNDVVTGTKADCPT
jgi:type IV pilus assembly protein PilW